ncbi:hypothetical protein NQ315_012630 [Exocentrus adspersus]|uniref:Protoporphyrinogen oxidase n=1 Tax=Exocentrus adspersus TaxID=1586481 RepID=A0AAV8VSA3_9CUCU|nr:hypothetical protein NQ315_012630 [Exocentrus adspersus]
MSKIILGGGISGLSAAYYLSKTLPKHPVTLVEASNRVGGWIKSFKPTNEVIFEQGPRTIRPTGPPGANTLSLIEDLGLTDQVLPITASHPAASNRMVYVEGKLHSLPSSIVSLFTTQKPFTKPMVRYLMRDLYAARKRVEDESIYDFTSRRFGEEFAEYLIAPLICGVCAGDAKEVSVKFLMKKQFEYEQAYGSISKGLLRNVFQASKPEALQGLALRARKERWRIYSFGNGMETLPEALSGYITKQGIGVVLNSKCTRLEFVQNEAQLHFGESKTLKTNHVISSIPSASLGEVVKHQHPRLAELLTSIKSVNVAVVNLHYKGQLIRRPGFGFLVPPKENVPILGVIYDSCCFPRSKDTVLTVMMGGKWFEQLFGEDPSEDYLLQVARGQLHTILGIKQEPVHFKVSILQKCIPQYVVGHDEKVREIQEYIDTNKLPLSVCGASYHGVGVNDVILSAKKVVRNLSER